MIEYVADREIYERFVLGGMFEARRFLWIATSDMKDMHVENQSGRMVSFLDVLSELVSRKVEVRVLHAKEPGRAFRRDFDRNGNLIKGMEMILCPRVHMKAVIVDGEFVYSGSANLTGAGMGAKNSERRNFEGGIVTDEKKMIEKIMGQFDSIWMGMHCGNCKRKEYCGSYKELI